jgi:hypothetical protein
MSALPSKADIAERRRHVRFVPKADILRCGKKRRYSITSSAATSRVCCALSREGVRSGRNRPPQRFAPERGLHSRSIFLAKSGGVRIFRREDR